MTDPARARCEKWLAEKMRATAETDWFDSMDEWAPEQRVKWLAAARIAADAIEKAVRADRRGWGNSPDIDPIPWDAVIEVDEGWPPLKPCHVCGKPKSPVGRDVAAAEANAYCHWTEHRAAEEEE